ncbi:MAG: pyridoxal phosphate-dependent aminotransferase [Sulfolobales archaeon]|nr:pyridoxal phosphate-dependent aminotransferase [Sulfolobales archaeon]MCX8208458.1 pyridoxal phosphate-dependent aminotransferase [Sulfolobales archaeon]MDW8010108.1 pyridoxal phosphate-dependent aminotransferase [Sulfolobales archaeon]
MSLELLASLESEIVKGLPVFCLERWQSLHETTARINLSESGVHPLSLEELGEYGVDYGDLLKLELSYGWTRGSPELRKAISELYEGSVDPENIVVTAGSAEANLLAVLALISSGDVVLVDSPNYMQIPGLLRWVGAKVMYLRRKPPKWDFPAQRAIGLMEELKPRAIFVTDPNNPTGSYMSRRELKELASEAERRGTVLVFDEVYWGTERGESKVSVAQVSTSENFVSVSSLSKTYGLPGLRLGWISSGSRSIANRVWSIKDYVSIAPPVLSDRVAVKILQPDVVRKLRIRARRVVSENLETINKLLPNEELIRPYPSLAGAYVWAEVPWTNNTLRLSYRVYEASGILVAPGECFSARGYVRVGVGLKPEILRVGFAELLEVLSNIKNSEPLSGTAPRS